MQFEVGDKVSIAATGRTGQIIHKKTEEYIVNGKLITAISYGIKLPPFYSFSWHKGIELKHLDKFEDGFEKQFELTFLNLMIDKYLDKRKFDIVKYYSNFKNEILKCGGGNK
jgi:hypothetical protein